MGVGGGSTGSEYIDVYYIFFMCVCVCVCTCVCKLRAHHLVPSLYGKQKGKKWKQGQILSWAPKSLQTVTIATKLKDACSLEGKV